MIGVGEILRSPDKEALDGGPCLTKLGMLALDLYFGQEDFKIWIERHGLILTSDPPNSTKRKFWRLDC